MKIEEFKDGIAFYSDDMEYEIAFYSKFTERVRYNDNNGYISAYTEGCIEIPYDDNRKIVDEIRRYRRALECGL